MELRFAKRRGIMVDVSADIFLKGEGQSIELSKKRLISFQRNVPMVEIDDGSDESREADYAYDGKE